MSFFDGEPNLDVLRQRAIAINEKFLNLSWINMKEICRFFTSYCLVVKLMLEDGVRSVHWYCHCEVFTKVHMCSGVLAVRLLLKEVKLPTYAAAFKGKKKRGPGAPPGINKKQRYAHVESESEHEDSGSEGDADAVGAQVAVGVADAHIDVMA